MSAEKVAPAILGWHIYRYQNNRLLVGRVVETEAYDQTDAASHSYRGITPRTSVMFGPPGFAYVYFTYGMHYCFNIVCGSAGYGSAVLIRAIEPLEGQKFMQTNRRATGVNLANGPAKLCQALAIDSNLNGHNLSNSPLRLVAQPPIPRRQIVTSTRIGITKDVHRPWRFYIKGSPYVSKT